jgi:hypothetical protein
MEGRKIVKVVVAYIAMHRSLVAQVLLVIDRPGEALYRCPVVTHLIYETINCKSYISPFPLCQSYLRRMRVNVYAKLSKSSQKL